MASISLYLCVQSLYLLPLSPLSILNRVESDFAQSGLSVDDLYSRVIVFFESTARAS